MANAENIKVWRGADVLSRLRTQILSGELPPKSRLRFSEMKKEFEVGIGTLREALAHLETEGFVRADAGRGYQVSPISKSDLQDIVELRVQFESNALSSSLANGDDAWEDEIVTAFHRLSRLEGRPIDLDCDQEEAWAVCHREFHMALVAACESRWTLKFHAILFDQAHRYRMVSRSLRDGNRGRGDEHRAIMEAVLARDLPQTLKLSEQHIRKTADIVSQRLTGDDLWAENLAKADARTELSEGGGADETARQAHSATQR